MILRPANKDLWYGRTSVEEEYWHQKIRFDIEDDKRPNYPSVALIGYPFDEGVRRNQGRPGARLGPDKIRQSLGKRAWHLDQCQVFDLGDVTGDSMEECQRHLATAVYDLLANGVLPIALGGGHDIANGHFLGIRDYLLSHFTSVPAIGIINFDAHFDLRPVIDLPNSGTPFYQIAQTCKDHDMHFKYLVCGIQKSANPNSLFDQAQLLNAKYFMAEEMELTGLGLVKSVLISFLDDVDLVYLSMDLDGFSSAYAPGVSAPSPMGFSPHVIMELLSVIISSGKLLSLDIAELNPHYDRDHITAQLASHMIEHVLTQYVESSTKVRSQ